MWVRLLNLYQHVTKRRCLHFLRCSKTSVGHLDIFYAIQIPSLLKAKPLQGNHWSGQRWGVPRKHSLCQGTASEADTHTKFQLERKSKTDWKKLPLFNSLLIYSLQSVTTLKRRENQLRVLRSTTLTTKVLPGQLAHATIACKCIPVHTWLSLVCALEMRKLFVLEPRPLRS